MVGKDNLPLLWTSAAVGSYQPYFLSCAKYCLDKTMPGISIFSMKFYIDSISSNLSVYIALTVSVVVFFLGGLAIINNSIDFWGGGDD